MDKYIDFWLSWRIHLSYIKYEKYVESKEKERAKSIRLELEKLKSKDNYRNDLNNTQKFAPRIINLTNVHFTQEEELLNKGNKNNTKYE